MEIKIHVPFLFWKYHLANTGRYFLHRREKAIRILAPAPYKIKEEINNDSPKTAVKRLIKEYGLSE